ncbi:MAG: permease [Ornithinimicrobium sp.]|uniref:permease n=1 Tax=Ornithinimicrobium sp. TaxID=1977084 RepID=UPI0026DF374E|nr:permease [Ornithinimicrobium sp.]MDO5740875.1 permease [Ornithinimicrobium sp.]
MSRAKFKMIYITVCAVLFLPTIFPLFALGNRAEPIVVGLPFSFFWVLLWVVLVGISVVALYFFDPDNKVSRTSTSEAR